MYRFLLPIDRVHSGGHCPGDRAWISDRFPGRSWQIRVVCWVGLLLGFLTAGPRFAQADVVWLQDGTVLYGQVADDLDRDPASDLERQLALVGGRTITDLTSLPIKSLHFRQFQQDGKLEAMPIKIDCSKIAAVHVSLDQRRLSQLNPGQPLAYFEYAEELLSETADPLSQQLARRLLLLSIQLLSKRLSLTQSSQSRPAAASRSLDAQSRIQIQQHHRRILQSALAALLSVTDRPETRKQIELYRLLRTRGSQVSTTLWQTAADRNWDATQGRLMKRLVQAIRRGQSQPAIDLLREPANRTAFSKWADQVTLEDLDKAARSGQPSQRMMQRLLSIETEIERMLTTSNDTGKPSLVTGSKQLQRRRTFAEQAVASARNSVVVPTLSSLKLPSDVQIDLEKTVYRNGRWQKPTAR